MDRKAYAVGLTIGHRGKGVPYGGRGAVQEDGTANYGFKNLKGRPHLLSDIPELQDHPSLYALIEAINRPENGLVSVGCAAWDFSDEDGFRWSGYIEFAINSAEMVEDARSYFPLFFRFDELLHDSGFDQKVNYNWELAPAHFSPAMVDGFTCTIWVYTPYFPSPAEAKDAWDNALGPVVQFLGGYPRQRGQPLFTAETPDPW